MQTILPLTFDSRRLAVKLNGQMLPTGKSCLTIFLIHAVKELSQTSEHSIGCNPFCEDQLVRFVYVSIFTLTTLLPRPAYADAYNAEWENVNAANAAGNKQAAPAE